MSAPSCLICGKSFAKKHNLLRHQNTVHTKDGEALSCNECYVSCPTKRQFIKHWRSVHSTSSHKIKRNFLKICPLCKCEEKDIMNHFTATHNIQIKEENLEFNNLHCFNAWKEEIEKKSLSKFVHKTTNSNRGENIVKKYICNRSGVYQSQSRGIRHLKTQGWRKINAFCPASIVVTISSQVRVKFINCHVGHEHELCHFNISPSMKEIIVKKLINKVPKKCILDEIRNNCDGVGISRDDLISNKDINNIALKYKISPDVDEPKTDAINRNISIIDLQQEYSSFVRFFKPQDTLNENHLFLKEEDFLLILMNSAQCDILKLYSGNIICVDNTYGVAENFYVFTILIMDDYHQGFPCSFMISNRNDVAVLELFYKTIEDAAGRIKPKVFMSNISWQIYSAWQNVMGSVETRLFCSWHVLKAWRENMKKIRDTEKQKIVLKSLNAILYELDENKFNLLLDDVTSWFRNDHDCRDFGLYFLRNFEKITKNWAYCYRKRAGVNTNVSLERLHHTLKYVNFKEENMNRLDKCIHSLLKFAQDKLFDRLITLHKGKVSTKLKTLRSRHHGFTSVQVTCEENSNFERFLVTSDANVYHVVLINETCTCKLICSDCNSCIHKYSCECLDNAIKFNMCEHIHAVCQFVINQSAVVSQDWIPVSNKINDCTQLVGAIDENRGIQRRSILEEIGMQKLAHVTVHDVQSLFNDIHNMVKDNPALLADFYQNLKNSKQKYEAQVKSGRQNAVKHLY